MELVVEKNMSDLASAPEVEDKEVTVEGRFGAVTANVSKALYFPHGVLGFEEAKGFVLTEFPTPKMNEHFRLLQSLDKGELSFIAMPMGLENGVIASEDLTKACDEIGVVAEKVIVALIASPVKVDGVMQVTVNAKAPILIDAETRMGCQFVFSHDKYDMKHDVSAVIAGVKAA